MNKLRSITAGFFLLALTAGAGAQSDSDSDSAANAENPEACVSDCQIDAIPEGATIDADGNWTASFVAPEDQIAGVLLPQHDRCPADAIC